MIKGGFTIYSLYHSNVELLPYIPSLTGPGGERMYGLDATSVGVYTFRLAMANNSYDRNWDAYTGNKWSFTLIITVPATDLLAKKKG